jgi:hypothetical protein
MQKRLALIPPIAVTFSLSAEVFMVAAAQFLSKLSIGKFKHNKLL